MNTVKLGDEQVTIQPFSGRKSIRALKILKAISKGVPQVLQEWAAFNASYSTENALVLDRTQARFRFPEDTEHMTDQDWEANGQQLKLPQSPTMVEQVAAVFPSAMDLAEEQVLQLLALAVVSNDELGRRARADGAEGVTLLLTDRADELLDQASGTELLELAVVASETVEQEFKAKVDELGDRVGNLWRLFGLTKTESSEATSPTDSKPTSSTDSPPPTGGGRSEPSTAPTGDASSVSTPA
jgi:hypothetical protein